MIRLKKIIFMFMNILLFLACTSNDKNVSVLKPEFRTSPHSVLNYEDASRSIYEETLNDHYQTRTEVEHPSIIQAVSNTIRTIYLKSEIEGFFIASAEADVHGKIISYKVVKNAGLGLDQIAISVLTNLKISPPYHFGKPYPSQLTLSIYFKKRVE